MAKSSEYPDLTCIPPKSYSIGRPYGRPIWIVCHTTEGSEGKTSAEAGAAYDAVRNDGTSTHYFHDEDTTIQCVRTENRANAAKGTGNHRGIHHELCGRAAQNVAQWDDAASQGTIEHFAKQAARDSTKWKIPVRKLTIAQVRAYESGFCEHNDISKAFGESDHSDPGRNYPWDETLRLVRDYQEDDMTADEMFDVLDKYFASSKGQARIAEATWNKDDVIPKLGNPTEGNKFWAGTTFLHAILDGIRTGAAGDATRDAALLAAVQGIQTGGSPAEFAAAIAPYIPNVSEEQIFEAFRRAFTEGETPAP